MEKKQKLIGVVSLLIFALGITLALVIAVGIVWGDFEAALFDPGISADSTLRGFRCPVAITTHEVGKISATLKNSTDRDKSFYVRAHITEGYVLFKREINMQVPVAAGDKEQISWEIYPEDAVYHRLVLFRVYVNASYPDPSRGNLCGVLVVDFPGLTGGQLFILSVALSLAAVIGGRYFWRKSNPNINSKNAKSVSSAITGLAFMVYFTMLIGYLGLWIFGVLLVAITVLMIGVILGRFVFAI
ncbi:MAG TPA: hypothetical protein DEH25_10255 [Chloroflexi bacterium]|nr:hypothetical protein [Chloroflexota bacterium]HBY08392.1 hypothetical protein [Chloroflexota bacterium]